MRTQITSLIVAALVLHVLAPHSKGIPASPYPVRVAQPDGTEITLYLKGDEYFHWYVDKEGFTVVQDGDTYTYAVLDAQNRLAPSQFLVGQTEPAEEGLRPGLMPPREVVKAVRAQTLSAPSTAPSVAPPSMGSVKNVVILMRFQNHLGRPCPPTAISTRCSTRLGGIQRMPRPEACATYIWRIPTAN